MSDVLGAAASGGMLMLIGLLILVFLKQINLVTGSAIRFLIRMALLTFAAGAVYLAAGALVFHHMCQDLESAANYQTFFRTAYLERVYDDMQHPAWHDVLTGIFVYTAHGLGALMLGQYASAGIVTAWGMTCGALCLFASGMKRLFKSAQEDEMTILVCLPCSVFFFLPGWAPILLFLLGFLFFLVSKRIPPRERRPFPRISAILYSVSCLLSACVTAALAMGRIA